MKISIAVGVIRVVLVPWQAHGGEKEQLEKRPMLETESEQIGLEWGQLLTRRVLKKFEDITGEKYLE